MDLEEEAYYPYDRNPQNEEENEDWPWRQETRNKSQKTILTSRDIQNKKPSWRQC